MRLRRKLTLHDLKKLRELATKEHENFCERNSHLASAYGNSLIAICLCQGAASHYMNPKVGIKDFDIWHFYREDSRVPFPYRAHKRIEFGYENKPLDFLKRTIPRDIVNGSQRPDNIIRTYLLQRNTFSKKLLLKKAVVGLFPDSIFGEIILEGEATKSLAGA